MAKQLALMIFLLSSAVDGRDCEKACQIFEDNNQKYLVHEAKVACKKHNISPRPTTEDICLSTFRALTRSTCLNYCDRTPLVPEVTNTLWMIFLMNLILFLFNDRLVVRLLERLGSPNTMLTKLAKQDTEKLPAKFQPLLNKQVVIYF